MKYCIDCGNQLNVLIPHGDNLPRHCCPNCGWTHYSNPNIIVACTLYDDERVLWIKRAIEPQKNYWCLPSGFMEIGETLQAAACRELKEETGIEIEEQELWLYSIGTLDIMDQVHVNFRARYRGQPYAKETAEASSIQFFSQKDLPWQQLAYPVLNISSKGFYQELQAQEFGVYVGGVRLSGDIDVEKVAISLDKKIIETR